MRASDGSLATLVSESRDLLDREQQGSSLQLMRRAIELAIEEDLGSTGDVTTQAVVKPNMMAKCTVCLKQPGVIAGLDVLAQVMQTVDPIIHIETHAFDGTYVEAAPYVIASGNGPASSILKAERLALNLLQRMSGIATWTRKFVELARPCGIHILDTRKTAPALRAFDRYAVKMGGGVNHRFGLYDAILIKDNHIKLAGSIHQAVESVRELFPYASIEVETTTLADVSEAISCKVDRILLDNMTPEMVRESVKLIRNNDKRNCFIEVSGGISLQTLSDFLIPGVDAISVGALTHSAPNIDISLEVEQLVC